MLKPERAREQLAQWRSQAHWQLKLARANAVSSAVGQAAMDLSAGDQPAASRGNYEEQRAAQRRATLAAWDPQLRSALFAALFPGLQHALEAAWRLCARLPYTVGYVRRGFRGPGREQLALLHRQRLLLQVYEMLGTIEDQLLEPHWLAAWAVHLERPEVAGWVLAGALDHAAGTDAVLLETIQDCAAARHDIGGPGQHALRALLCCSLPSAWSFVGQLLLAAQRQEGLRQSILEALDEAHPDAFAPLLRLVIEQDLLRFAAVARAVGVWLGEDHSALEPKALRTALLDLQQLLADPVAHAAALQGGEPQRCFRALWCSAFRDAEQALPLCPPLLAHADPAIRLAAAHWLSQCGLPEARALLLPLLDDPHPELVAVALLYLRHGRDYSYELKGWDQAELGALSLYSAPSLPVPPVEQRTLFEQLVQLIDRLPAKAPESSKRLVKEWVYPAIGKSDAADLLERYLGERAPRELLPWLSYMTPYAHAYAIAQICKPGELDGSLRELLIGSVSHPSSLIREAALDALKKCTINEAEAVRLEALLTRTQADFRRAVFGLLGNREDAAVETSVARLLDGKHALQRAAGIELARQLIDAGRHAEPLRMRLLGWREQRAARLSTAEAEAITQAVMLPEAPLSLVNCLGLIDPGRRTAPLLPRFRSIKFSSLAACALLRSLDELIEAHKTQSIALTAPDGSVRHELLGSTWRFPHVGDKAGLPLCELWTDWYRDRPAAQRDADGFELLRALLQPTDDRADPRAAPAPEALTEPDLPMLEAAMRQAHADGTPELQLGSSRAFLQPLPRVALRYQRTCRLVLGWLLQLQRPAQLSAFLLDAMEAEFSCVPPTELTRQAKLHDWQAPDWRDRRDVFMLWAHQAIADQAAAPQQWDASQLARLHGLLRWRDQPVSNSAYRSDPHVPQVSRRRPDPHLLLRLHGAGAATIEDVLDELIGERAQQHWGQHYFLLQQLTREPGSPDPNEAPVHPEVQQAVGRARARLFDTELKRGEAPTLATAAIKAVSTIPGLESLLRVLRALGKQEFRKPEYRTGDNKVEILTRLARVCVPLPEDSIQVFAERTTAAIGAGEFPQARLLELALLNPRWVAHIAHALAWPGIAEAVYWFIAHTPNDWQHSYNAGQDAGTAQLQAAIKARTSLSAEQRNDGLVDVSWFQRAYRSLADDSRWDAIEAAAKFLGWGMGHRKAARLADVLLGRIERGVIVAAIEQRQLKEFVRLLGLLPLPDANKLRKADLVERHAVLKRYERYAKGLSAMSKPAALSAVQLGFDNLAITAGYSDPLRLQWSVSADQVADLATGAVEERHGDVSLRLSLDAAGIPQLEQFKAGKPLKALPAESRKQPALAALIERRNALQQLRSASVSSLEQAMCQGTELRGDEVNGLLQHALLRPLLEALLLVAPSGLGYPQSRGQMRRFDGALIAFKPDQPLRIAHPLDVLAVGDWPQWQRECLAAQRLQPFKQLFRELYVPTAADLDGQNRVQRYAGQQVNPAQANALLATRGWSVRDGVSKLFAAANLVAELDFEGAVFTPTEVEAPTVGGLVFHRRGDWQRMLLKDVPALVFSECLRDLDLVVSVAHAGGVDPEASHSTVDMRAALLRETCALLGLNNVRVEQRHALIHGTLGDYSVHLGSGSVHQQPGGALSIVAVQGQHRGRLFLPFADNDPRTAEVLSKVLLLARDQQIQDPTVLAQIVRN